MGHGGGMEGIESIEVSEAVAAAGLGFASVEDLRAWRAAGSPTGRCSNERCGRPAFWPDLENPCIHCGYPVEADRSREKKD